MLTDLLFENFQLLADTPGGVQKLRELILQLAVQGKLAPQDPEDEPASVLLDRIREEKERLIKEGKIKKQKPLPEIKPEEVPFELPEGWEWARLGDITSRIGSGSTPRGGKNAYVESGVPFLRSQNIWNEGLYLENIAYIPITTHQKMDHTKVLSGDILLNITGASLGRCTLYPNDLGEANVSQHVTIIRPIDHLTRLYLHIFILSPYAQSLIWGRQVGMAREGLSKKVLQLFEIPLPPLSEQHRIVAKVDQLMALCDELEAKKEKQKATHARLNKSALQVFRESKTNEQLADNWTRVKNNFHQLFTTPESVQELRSTILQLAVQGKLVPQNPQDEPASALLERIREEKQRLVKEGKIKKQKPLPEIKPEEVPFELPEGWELTRLGNIASFENGDRSSRYPKENDCQTGGIPFFGAKDMVNGILSFDNGLRFISKSKFYELKNGKLEDRDFVVLLRGSVGKVAIFYSNSEYSTGFINAQMLIIRLLNGKVSTFFNIYIWSFLFQRLIADKSTGSAVKQIPGNVFPNFIVPLPPLPEQYRIAAKVDQLMAICDELESSLSQSQADGEKLMAAVVEEISGSRQESDTKLRNPAHQSPDEVASSTNHKLSDIAPANPQPVNSAHSNPEPSTAGYSNPESDTSKSNNTAAAILAYMQPGEQYTRSDIMEALNLPGSAWITGIRELKGKGLVVQTGEKRGARYGLCDRDK